MSDPLVACSVCGRAAPEAGPPLTWLREHARGRVSWVCEDCARRHLRSIEAKLDAEWW